MLGETIAHYKILEELGEGGMGTVYKAEDIRLMRPVALKFLSKEFTGSQKARERFKREAQAAAALNHPNIVTIYEIDEVQGQTYIAMEYVEGQTLKEHVGAKHSGQVLPENHLNASPLPVNKIIDITTQICEGLQKAHEAGIVHRDIKPQNILIDKYGRVKIVDFGVAKLQGKRQITDKIVRIGTADYMSPEQSEGEELDRRADIWSLGVVLYEMVTGQLPFKGESESEIIDSILYRDPLPPTKICSSIPVELEKIILQCLQKDRKDRYQGAQPLSDELKELEKSYKLRGEKEEAPVKRIEKPAAGKETERRLATLVSAEILGYNEMLEELDAEEAASIMNSCFEMLNAIVEKYGGGVDKIMGSSFTVLFGIPMAMEDAPKKAVNAAIEMRNTLCRFNKENNLITSLDIRMGINSGMVIAGETYSVIGDTVSLAAFLKDLSTRGQILVGPTTYRYTRDEFDYKRLRPIALEGRTKLTTIFALLSTKEKLYRLELSPERMIYSEMVGREKELDKLKLHLLKVINGEGSIVSVIGEAGIGKSRLIAEIKEEEDLKKVTMLEGRALSIGKNLSYHPIIDVLKQWAKIKENDNEKESFLQLETAITNIYPRGAAEVFPFVATMMGMKLAGKHAERVKGIEGEALETLILKNVRELIVNISGKEPLILVVEDLHWADISSIELLESLFRLAENHPVLFINVFRPNYRETGERLLETIRERYPRIHAEVYLEPLDEKECEELIRNLVKIRGLPQITREDIARSTEGNPFFIEEVIRSFIDGGVVELKDGEFKVTKKIDSVVIPERIQDVLMARIDRLDETTKALLKEASVIGRYFFYKILVHVTEISKDIDDRLEYLKGIQLIRERRRLEEIEYLFKHALVQEVTYESILLKKRKELHLKVARAIESEFAGKLHEIYGMLALHYSRGENAEKAEEYLIKAGEEASKAAASGEALYYYQGALKLYHKKHRDSGDPETIANLEWNIARAFLNKGQMAKAVEHFDRVLALWGERRPKNKIITLFYFLTSLLRIIKNLYLPSRKAKLIPTKRDNDMFEVTYHRATALAHININRMVTDSIRCLATIHKYDLAGIHRGVTIYAASSALFFMSGKSFAIARKLLDYAESYIEPGDIKTLFKYNLWELQYDTLSGNWDRELQYNKQVVDTILQEGDLFTAISHLSYSGGLLIEKGDFTSAKPYIDKLVEIGEVYESNLARMGKYFLTTRLLTNSKRLRQALPEVDAGISLTSSIGQDLDLLIFLEVKSKIQLLLEDIPGAEKTLQQAGDLISLEIQVAPWHMGDFYLTRFLLNIYKLEKKIKTGDKSEIKRFGQEAYFSGRAAVKKAAKLAPIRTETFKLMGVYYWLVGRQKRALKWWAKSIQTGEGLGARPELAKTYMEVGKRLLGKKSRFTHLNGIQAKAYLKKARLLFEEMELDWDLNELDKIKSQIATGGQ